jgi:hypothetical protein
MSPRSLVPIATGLARCGTSPCDRKDIGAAIPGRPVHPGGGGAERIARGFGGVFASEPSAHHRPDSLSFNSGQREEEGKSLPGELTKVSPKLPPIFFFVANEGRGPTIDTAVGRFDVTTDPAVLERWIEKAVKSSEMVQNPSKNAPEQMLVIPDVG